MTALFLVHVLNVFNAFGSLDATKKNFCKCKVQALGFFALEMKRLILNGHATSQPEVCLAKQVYQLAVTFVAAWNSIKLPRAYGFKQKPSPEYGLLLLGDKDEACIPY